MLYGVTSKVSCGQENAASVFTKTASSWNTPWIAENLARECPDPSGECLFPAFTGVPVTWLGAKQTKIVYQNSDSVLAQINIPNWQFDFDVREEPYMIFLIFQRLYCGQGFFDAYNNGMYKTIMDNGDYYEMQGSYTHINDRYSSLTQQIRMHTAGADDIPFWKKTGLKSTKKDQLFLFMNNLSTVEWGNKDWKTCLEKMVVGAMPMPASVGDANGDFDFTSCVGKEKVVGFG